MSGRGVWWEVRRGAIVGTKPYDRPVRFRNIHIDQVIAQLAHEGDEEAIAAVLECPDDATFQLAVREYEEEK